MCNVASVCTGLGTEGWALEDVGVLHKHVVCCEIEEILRTHIEHHFEPMYMVKDALSNKFLNTPPPEFKSPIHLLVGGFPCQPFASNGLNQGFDDEAGRGVVIHHIIKWIRRHEPKAFVLENVSGLLYRHKEEFHTILKALTNLKLWNVSWKLINSCDHGVPQDTRDLTRKLGLVSPAGAVGDQRYKLFHEIESEQQRSQHSRFSWTWCCASNFDAPPQNRERVYRLGPPSEEEAQTHKVTAIQLSDFWHLQRCMPCKSVPILPGDPIHCRSEEGLRQPSLRVPLSPPAGEALPVHRPCAVQPAQHAPDA